jgi:toxin ParE1/3/4
MPSFKYTRRSSADITGIIEYIAKDSQYAAENFSVQLIGKFYALAETPYMGRERDDYGAGVRTFPFGNYMIFYRPTTEGITIVRVLHGARNLPGAFTAES